MPYTEKYPLNPTPQGDSTKEAVLKNREEIKRRRERSPAACFVWKK